MNASMQHSVQHSNSTGGISALQPPRAHVSLPALHLDHSPWWVCEQCDLPASPADPARVPLVLHSYSMMASHSTTQVWLHYKTSHMLSAHQTVTLWLLRCLLIFLPLLTWCLAIKARKKKEFDHSSTISPVLKNMLNQNNTASYERLLHPFSEPAPKPFCRPSSSMGSSSRMVLFPTPGWEGMFSKYLEFRKPKPRNAPSPASRAVKCCSRKLLLLILLSSTTCHQRSTNQIPPCMVMKAFPAPSAAGKHRALG